MRGAGVVDPARRRAGLPAITRLERLRSAAWAPADTTTINVSETTSAGAGHAAPRGPMQPARTAAEATKAMARLAVPTPEPALNPADRQEQR